MIHPHSRTLRHAIVLLTLFLPFVIRAQFPNVTIGTQNEPNEPCICIDPTDPTRMVAGSNIANYYYSADGGLTWADGVLTSPYGVWGDPVIIADTAGDFYFFHLSVPTWPQWLDRIVCQKSTDGGMTWSDGTYMGLNGSKDQDKEWAIVDPATNTIHVCWTQFDEYNSTAPGDSTVILYSRSADGGQTWSNARRINRVAGDCLDMDNTVEGAVPAVGPQGQVYVSWAGPEGLTFNRSPDGGITWPDINTVISDFPGGWDYSIPGISRANGLPVTCCDLSEGPYRGRIYVNWSDQRNGTDDTDIWFVRSEDGGVTWTQPKRVNDDPPGKHQFFTWMTVDRSTGYIYMVFYDRRDHAANLTDVYMAVSRDGGDTFQNFRVSESPFNPNSTLFFGDYTHIAAVNGIVRPVWTRLHGGNLSVVTALVDNLFTSVNPEKNRAIPLSLEQNYPNPVKDITRIAFKIREPSRITLTVHDLAGNEVARIVNDQWTDSGKHILSFDRTQYGLPAGFYFYSLVSGDQTVRRKMVAE